MFSRSVKQFGPAAFRRFNHTLPPWANKPAFTASAEAAQSFKAGIEESAHHAQSTSDLWKRVSYFVAIPSILIAAVFVVRVELEHAHHREHNLEKTDEEWPTQYPYMNIRSKDFFWGDGDKTLFWNPVVNRHIRDD